MALPGIDAPPVARRTAELGKEEATNLIPRLNARPARTVYFEDNPTAWFSCEDAS